MKPETRDKVRQALEESENHSYRAFTQTCLPHCEACRLKSEALALLDADSGPDREAMELGARLALEAANRILENEGISIDFSTDAIIRAHVAQQESKPC